MRSPRCRFVRRRLARFARVLVGWTHEMTRALHLPTGTRPWLAVGTAVSAFAFGWAAFVLPWRAEAPLGLALWTLAALHACTALTAICWPRRLVRPLQLLALASLAAAPVFLFAVSATSLEMVRMYGPLGWALTAALAAIAWLLLLGTVPVGVFGLYVTRSHGRS
jgi:hypothetical protein